MVIDLTEITDTSAILPCAIANCNQQVWFAGGEHLAPLCYARSLDALEFYLAQVFQRRPRYGLA